MTTFEYIRWKANITRKSKIVKSKIDKAKEEEKMQQEQARAITTAEDTAKKVIITSSPTV